MGASTQLNYTLYLAEAYAELGQFDDARRISETLTTIDTSRLIQSD
jgi:hypothetical protein